jgi:hypothetical protein
LSKGIEERKRDKGRGMKKKLLTAPSGGFFTVGRVMYEPTKYQATKYQATKHYVTKNYHDTN